MSGNNTPHHDLAARIDKILEGGCTWGQKETELISVTLAAIEKRMGEIRNELKSDIQNVETPINVYNQMYQEVKEKLAILGKDIQLSASGNEIFKKAVTDEMVDWKAKMCLDMEGLVGKFKTKWWQPLLPIGMIGVMVTVAIFAINSITGTMEKRLEDTTRSYEKQMQATTASLTTLVNHVLDDYDKGKLTPDHFKYRKEGEKNEPDNTHK